MKKKIIAAILSLAFVLTACQGRGAGTENGTNPAVDSDAGNEAVNSAAGNAAGAKESTKTGEEGAGEADSSEADKTGTSGADTSSADNTDLQNAEQSAQAAEALFENLPPLNVLDDKYRTTYEIFVYSFADSNGDGVGDLQGVIDKLDYINDGDDTTSTDLGFNQIWLMPISPSPTYHKYDVTDYKDIDSQYGTLEDFDNLIKACHDRGIKVIIDLVLNHTSSQHPWFKEAKEYLKNHADLESLYTDDGKPISDIQKECPYLYYYNFSKEQQTGYEKVNGTQWYYEARFWSEMPDLNLDSEEVFKEITDITKFWTDRGVDGFRLDAVAYYYTNDNVKNIDFMAKLNNMVKSQNKDAYIVAEAWVAQSTYAEFYASGIDSFFDFEFSGSEGLIASVARGKKAPILYAKAMAAEEELYASKKADYVNAPFYTNHDMARSAGYFVGKGSQNMVKMAGALNLLMGGNAFVYYGEELGMKGSGKDENKRAPMQWTSLEGDTASSSSDAAIMCTGPSGMETFEMPYPALDQQAADPYSIYNYYKKAIRLRNTYPVIARGRTLPLEDLSSDRLGVFVKYEDGAESYSDDELLIVINNGSEAQSLDLSKWKDTASVMGESADYAPELAYYLTVDEKVPELEGTALTVPSYGIAVIK